LKAESKKVKQEMKQQKEKIAATNKEIQQLQNDAVEKNNELEIQKLQLDFMAGKDHCTAHERQMCFVFLPVIP
jgi:hypothetical protein